MNRTSIFGRPAPMLLGAVVIGLTAVCVGRADGGAEARRPNIIVILADDLGWMDLGCQGNDRIDTPNLDRLADQGMRFTDAYAAAPVCTPTRAAMMTGLSPARLAITNHAPGNQTYRPNGTGLLGAEWSTFLSLEHMTLAERLRDAGYATGFFGKWHLSHRPGQDAEGPYEPRLRAEHQGFDVNIGGCRYGGPPTYFEPYRIPNIPPRKAGEYLPERLADEALAFVKENLTQPFFLSWWCYAVHYPMEAPQHLIDKYANRPDLNMPDHRYAAMIEGMDAAIGRFLATLDELGVSDNTLLIFKSDNGSNQGNRPLRAGKGHLYEGGIRVPWIVRWPGVVSPSSTCATPVISMDTYPTILEAVGLTLNPDEARDGQSIIPLLRQTGSFERESLYFHYPNYAYHKQNRLGSAIRRGDYKLIQRYDDGSIELYNLAQDIGEQRNLADQKPRVARQLQQSLKEWLKETKAKMPIRDPQE